MFPENRFRRTQQSLLECLVALACLFIFFRNWWPVLTGRLTLGHDNVFGDIPLFHHFAASLLEGSLPFWDPYSTTGVPYYFILPHIRLLDPLTYLVVLVGGTFTRDTVILFHWNRAILSLVTAGGVYLLLRPWCKTLGARLAVLPVAILSYFTLGSFRQPGVFHNFAWQPFLIYFLIRLVYRRQHQWSSWLWLGGVLVIMTQSYYVVSTSLTLLFFGLGFFLFHRNKVLALVHCPQFKAKVMFLLAVGLCGLAPNLALLQEEKNLVFPIRMVVPGTATNVSMQPVQYDEGPEAVVSPVKLTYSAIMSTGTISRVWDTLQSLYPDRALFQNASLPALDWRAVKDGHFFLGLVVWCLAIFGFFFGRSPLKKVWLLYFALTALFILGPPGGVHPLLYWLYPPVRLFRHTQFCILASELALLYFFVLGCNRLFSKSLWPEISSRRYSALTVILGIGFSLALFEGLILLQTPREHWKESVLIFLPIILGAALFRKISKAGMFLAVLFAILAALILRAPSKAYFLQYCAYSFGFILALAGFHFTRVRPRIAASVLSALLVGHITFEMSQSLDLHFRYFIRLHPHPSRVMPLSMEAGPLQFPSARDLYPIQAPIPMWSKGMQQLALLHRRPFVFQSSVNGPYMFRATLKGKRWASVLLNRPYFELIHSNVPAEAIAAMTAYKREILQFKSSAIPLEDSEILGFLEKLGPKASLELLKNTILISGDEPPIPKFHEGQGTNFTFNPVSYTHNHMEIDVHADRAGFLYWADGFNPWWSAKMDGNETRLLRANFNFKAVYLPAGNHRVEFTFFPLPFVIGLFLYFSAIVVSLGLATWLEFFQSGSRFPKKAMDFLPEALPA